jgi:hypothetical protein
LFSNSNVSVYSCCIFSVPLLGFYLWLMDCDIWDTKKKTDGFGYDDCRLILQMPLMCKYTGL